MSTSEVAEKTSATEPITSNTSVRVVLHPAFRSQYKLIILFLITSYASIVGSKLLPFTVVHGELIRFDRFRYFLDLPLLWFLPAFFLGKTLFNIYNVAYIFFGRGIESRDGILSLQTRVTRIRFEDVRVIEVHQSIFQRILGIGQVDIGTAATAEVEIMMYGVLRPSLIQEVTIAERDRIRKEKITEERTVSTPENPTHEAVNE